MCELCRAIDALDARKTAVLTGVEDPNGENNRHARALLCAGTKVDVNVAVPAANAAAMAFMPDIAAAMHGIVGLADDATPEEFTERMTKVMQVVHDSLSGLYFDGLLTGLLVADPPPPRRQRVAVFDTATGTRTEFDAAPEADLYSLLQESVSRVRKARRTPLWTRCEKGVSEAERDRRRRPRR